VVGIGQVRDDPEALAGMVDDGDGFAGGGGDGVRAAEEIEGVVGIETDAAGKRALSFSLFSQGLKRSSSTPKEKAQVGVQPRLGRLRNSTLGAVAAQVALPQSLILPPHGLSQRQNAGRKPGQRGVRRRILLLIQQLFQF
jgi:hypothetical protein